jgi:putative transposase
MHSLVSVELVRNMDDARDTRHVSDTSNTPDLANIPGRDWDLARQRLAVISRLAEAAVCTRSAAKRAAQELGCSVALIYRLLARYQADPRLTHFLPRPRGRRHGQMQLTAELEEIIKTAIEELYLTRQRPPFSELMREIARRCKTVALPTPSRKAVQARVNTRGAAEITTRREGRKAARDRFAPAAGALEAPSPLALVQIDHTLVDVIVVDSVARTPIQRPWLTLAIDVCSRCALGFHLSLDAPSATSVALCVAHAALPKDGWLTARGLEGAWPSGVPRRLHLDNAREFHSEALRRGCEQYAIAVDYRPVRTPHYGGHIERLIGTMMGKVHLLPGTTCGSPTRADS